MTRRKSARYTLYRETAAVATNDWGDFVYFYLFFVRVFHANAFTRTLSLPASVLFLFFIFFCVESHTLCLVVSPLVVCGNVYTDSKLCGWLMVEVLLYVHRNRRFISGGSPGRPPRLSHSAFDH